MKSRLVAAVLGAVLMAAVPGTAAAAPIVDGERVESRTGSTTTVVRPDGARTLTLYSGAVALRRGAQWAPMDLTLVAGPDGVVRPAATTHDIALTPTGPVVRFAGGGSAALDWPTALPTPDLDGHRATYAQARPGYDLVVEATRVGFVASLRRAGAAPEGPVAPLALRGRAEVVPSAGPGPDGAPSLTETESAVSRVVAAAPPSSPAPFDTTVQTTILHTDTSGEPDLRVGSHDGVAVARSYLTWDLAQLAGRPVAGALLRLHQDWSASCRARGWEVWSAPAAGPTTRWADQPVADRAWATSAQTVGHGPDCAPGWAAVDVTDLVRSWAGSGAPTGTVQLRASDEADPLSWKRFGAAEGPNVPHLEITLG